MPELYITMAQPNPPGRDRIPSGRATNPQLNEEWVEFRAEVDRVLNGDILTHITFAPGCKVTGSEQLMAFNGLLSRGQSIRVHTGVGTNHLDGSRYHFYAGLSAFRWNNDCGDRATLSRAGYTVDSAGFAPRPREGVLVRVPGTDQLR